MKNYVYKISDNEGNFYIGSRTSKSDPESDTYAGSGVWPKTMKREKQQVNKEIISKHQTRKDACDAELQMILENKNNPRCMNISKVSIVPGESRKSAWAWMLTSSLKECEAKAIFLWMEVVALGGKFGISEKFLAQKNGITESECDRYLNSVLIKIDGDLPRIIKDGKIWKTQTA